MGALENKPYIIRYDIYKQPEIKLLILKCLSLS